MVLRPVYCGTEASLLHSAARLLWYCDLPAGMETKGADTEGKEVAVRSKN